MKTRSIIPKNAVLAEIEHKGFRVTAICEMGRTVNRTLRLRPLFVSLEDFDHLTEVMTVAISKSAEILDAPGVREHLKFAASATAGEVTDATVHVDAACLECGLHRAALDEIGCPRKGEALDGCALIDRGGA
jgi:hypothetical protein